MKNLDIASIFEEIANFLDLKGENPFRVKAYRKAAKRLESLSFEVSKLKESEITNIPDIGYNLGQKILEYLQTGKIELHESLKKEFPPILFDLMRIPGLGPKTAELIIEKFNLRNFSEFERLAKEGMLRTIRGIKRRKEKEIIRGIEFLKQTSDSVPLGIALPLCLRIVEDIRKEAPTELISPAGSIRRWKESVRNIDIVATCKKEKLIDILETLPYLQIVKVEEQTIFAKRHNFDIRMHLCPKNTFPLTLRYFTGSIAHNRKLTQVAFKKGFDLQIRGLMKDGKEIYIENEEEIYEIIGIPFIASEIREDQGEIESALEGNIPDLLSLYDIKGDLHIHSDFSDGKEDIETIVRTAREKGYEYIAITDHSKGRSIAKGLNEERLLKQIKLIEEIQKKFHDIHILKGIEVDIRADGSLDLRPNILKKLDLVIASIHSGFGASKEKITKRILTAIESGLVNIFAHPTGRLIGERQEYDADWKTIFKEAKKYNVAFEINAFPLRLDLNDALSKLAKKYGIPLAIGTDAHGVEQFDHMIYGVQTARRAWLEKKDVLNSLPYEELIVRLSRHGRG